MRRRVSLPSTHALLVIALISSTGMAATLPYHRPLRIVIVSDEVNPHHLSDAELTQPGDLSRALLTAGNGISISSRPESVIEIPTNEIERATALLNRPRSSPDAYDVLIYFAHRIPNAGPDPVGRQAAFTAAVEQFLVAGGGVVSFHHGAYFTSGKEGMLDLIGGQASGSVPWDTVTGQNVIATSPRQFVACYGVSYPSTTSYADVARGVPAGTYPFFNNRPDERYPVFNFNATAGPHTTLFASNYNDGGTTHLLGFTHERPAWLGRVVAYQPGEYEPNALDIAGNNFQILANALIWSSRALLPDDITLRVARTSQAGEVQLSWTSCGVSFNVYRSHDPAQVGGPSSLLGTTSAFSWVDQPPGAIAYYLVR